ncbi:MAG: hypothetical protein ACK56F_12870, partial [bacterium]
MGRKLNEYGQCLSPGWSVWVPELNKAIHSADVIFDESDPVFPEAAQRKPSTLKISAAVAQPKDFDYLVGMAYEDNGITFLTTRVEKYQSWVVAFRCPVVDNNLLPEELTPIHVRDVADMVDDYIHRAGKPKLWNNGEWDSIPDQIDNDQISIDMA